MVIMAQPADFVLAQYLYRCTAEFMFASEIIHVVMMSIPDLYRT